MQSCVTYLTGRLDTFNSMQIETCQAFYLGDVLLCSNKTWFGLTSETFHFLWKTKFSRNKKRTLVVTWLPIPHLARINSDFWKPPSHTCPHTQSTTQLFLCPCVQKLSSERGTRSTWWRWRCYSTESERWGRPLPSTWSLMKTWWLKPRSGMSRRIYLFLYLTHISQRQSHWDQRFLRGCPGPDNRST